MVPRTIGYRVVHFIVRPRARMRQKSENRDSEPRPRGRGFRPCALSCNKKCGTSDVGQATGTRKLRTSDVARVSRRAVSPFVATCLCGQPRHPCRSRVRSWKLIPTTAAASTTSKSSKASLAAKASSASGWAAYGSATTSSIKSGGMTGTFVEAVSITESLANGSFLADGLALTMSGSNAILRPSALRIAVRLL